MSCSKSIIMTSKEMVREAQATRMRADIVVTYEEGILLLTDHQRAERHLQAIVKHEKTTKLKAELLERERVARNGQ